MLKLDLLDVPNQRFNTVLNDVNIVIELRQFRKVQYLSLYIDDVLQIGGVKCIPDVLLLPSALARTLGGNLFFTTENEEYPSVGNLGKSCKLLYATMDELK